MKHTAEGTPTEVLIRALECLGESEHTEVLVIARDDQGELKFFSNLPFLTCRIGLCEGYLAILRNLLLKQES